MRGRPGAVVAVVASLAGALCPAAAADPWTREHVSDDTSRYGVALDTDVAGNAVAMWVDSSQVLRGARRPAGGSWSDPVALSEAGDYHFAPSSVALRENGSAYFAYSDYDLGGGALGLWSSDDTVSGTGVGGQDDRVRLFSDPDDGDVVVADTNANRGAADRTRLYLAGTDAPDDSWTSTSRLATLRPVVAFGAGHDYAVAEVATKRLVRVHRVDGATGASRTVLARDPGCGSRAPKGLATALDGRGRGLVAWRCGGDRGAVRAVYLRTTGASGTSTVASSRAGVDDQLAGPLLAAAPGGRVGVVHAVRRASGWAVLVRTRGPRGGFGDVATLARRQATLRGFAGSAAQSGAALVTWRDGGTTRALTRRPGGPFGPASPVGDAGDVGARPTVARDGTGFVSNDGDPVDVFVNP